MESSLAEVDNVILDQFVPDKLSILCQFGCLSLVQDSIHQLLQSDTKIFCRHEEKNYFKLTRK